jgi:hypothetical protein
MGTMENPPTSFLLQNSLKYYMNSFGIFRVTKLCPMPARQDG